MVPKVSVAAKYPLPLDTEGCSDVPEDGKGVPISEAGMNGLGFP